MKRALGIVGQPWRGIGTATKGGVAENGKRGIDERRRRKHLPSGNVIVILKIPPSHIVFSLPGIPHSHILRSRTPCAFLTGRAQKPNGWSFRHCFLYEGRENKILVSHLLYVSHDRNSNVPLLGKARLGQRHDGRDVLCAEDMR